MNQRERFIATMHYQERDRSPIFDFGFWIENFEIWQKQGLPEDVNPHNTDTFFGMDPFFSNILPVGMGLVPWFEEEIIEDLGEEEIVQQTDGVRVRRAKKMGSIPVHEGHLLTDRASWEKYYKPKLDPDNPGRFPADFDQRIAKLKDPNRNYPAFLPGGSFIGVIRNWLGMEELSYIVYDDPALFEEMCTTVADCIIGVTEKLLATGVEFEGASIWEDICYNTGPLINPEHFKQYLIPHYKRYTELLNKHGVDVIWLDCDGKIDTLLPLWLDAGVNTMFPLEIGTWGADPIKFRKEYGKDLLLLGGFDKHVLARTKQEIEAEVIRLTPLVEEGGYIGFCDHRVPPDVPLTNYIYYLDLVREHWGKGIDLLPMDPRVAGCR